jgi:L-malate glycosyltransferase
MNILLIISKNDRYGAQRIFLDQVGILKSMNNQVIVVCRGEQGFVPDAVRSLGVAYYGLPLKGFEDVWSLKRLVKKHDIHVIHTTLDRADYFGVLVSWLTRVPVVTTMMVPRYHPGFRFADKIVVLSEKLKKVLIEKGIHRKRITMIRPGIDVDRFAHPDELKRADWHDKLTIAQYSTVFCHVASLIPRKGHRVSLEIIAAYKNLGGNPLLIIIGDPVEGEYYRSLVDAVDELGLQKHVRFTGWTRDTAEIISLCHITLLPSENEALGIVLMEGMAAGTPIVAKKGEGGAELIEEYGTGYLYDEKNGIPVLAEQIYALRRDKKRYEALSHDCRKKAGELFTLSVFGQNLMAVYRSLAIHN